MTPQQLIGLGIRLLAIWLAIASFRYAILIPAALENMRAGENATQALLIAGVYALAALLLWLFPMWTAHKLLPRTRYDNTVNLQPFEAARVGCALIGLWLFVQGLLDGVWFLFRMLLIAGSRSAFETVGPDARLDFIVMTANIILGLALVLRAGRFAALVAESPVPPRDES